MDLQFELRREHHAITEFTASLHFFQGVSAATLAGVAETLRAIAADLDLPSAVPMQVVQFMIGPHGAAPSASSSSGLGFQRFSKDGEVAEALSCESDSITYVLRDYTVWENAFPTLVDIFTKLGLEYLKEVPAIQSIRLQYLNEFRAKSTEIKSASDLFKTDSRWVAPIAKSDAELWHSHVGLFIPRSENERQLVNVNCDINSAANPSSEERRLFSKVLCLAGCFYNVPGGQPLIVAPDELANVLREKLTESHSLEKLVLREVIAEPYLDAMGANDVD